MLRRGTAFLTVAALSCASGAVDPQDGAGGSGAATTSTSSSGGATGGAGGTGGGGPAKVCAVPAGALDASPPCSDREEAPLDSFDLVPKWTYESPPNVYFSFMPLVANLTDDNADGRIDLCDVPDVLVSAAFWPDPNDQLAPPPVEKLLMLSGADGSLERVIDPVPFGAGQPAIGDLDADGVPEIVVNTPEGRGVALSPEGAVVWMSEAEVFDPEGIAGDGPDPPVEHMLRAAHVYSSPAAIHDLDGDGSPEVLMGMTVLRADGSLRFQDPMQGAELGWQIGTVRPLAFDLNGDGKLEVLFGHVTYDADGNELWRVNDVTTSHATAGDFFGDGEVEVFLSSDEGWTLVDATGQLLWGPIPIPGEDEDHEDCWRADPLTADFDGNGTAEILFNTCRRRLVVEVDSLGPIVVRDEPSTSNPNFPNYMLHGWQNSTAFDFLGLGPDWVAYHADRLDVFRSSTTAPLISRTISASGGGITPVIADIDNDGSADLLLTEDWTDSMKLVAYEDSLHRPSPARRIWNQRSYSPGAVREDAKLPTQSVMPWETSQQLWMAQGRVSCSQVPR
jgi:hypothetical protein